LNENSTTKNEKKGNFTFVVLPDMTECKEYKMLPYESAVVVAFSPHAKNDDMDKTCLAQGLHSGAIALWTQTALRKGEGSHTFQGHRFKQKIPYSVAVLSVAFGSGQQQQQLLASGSADRTVRLWDINTKECVAVLEGHSCAVYSVAFSPDGCLLASASHDSTVRLWDVVGRRANVPVHVLRSHTHFVYSVSFSPDGRLLASGSHDRTVRLWIMPQGMPGPVLRHDECVKCVAFSPVIGSNVLASGCGDGIIRLWNMSRITTRELNGHFNTIESVAFSPDGSQLVSGSHDRTVRLWSVASGKLLKVLTGHSSTVYSVAFHPNGKQVASCSADATMRMWTVFEWSDRTH
jgi:WD40 repeat protein